MTVRIRLFGPFEVSNDAGPVELPARKTEALLAVLAVRPGVPCEREWLATLLWPNVPDAQGRTSLRQALGHLRKALSPELFVTSGDKVHLDPKLCWVDAAEVERALHRAPAEREALAELFRGPLLAAFPALEDPLSDWLAHERVAWAERAAAGMEECLAALSAAGHVERALAVGAALLAVEPTREGAHRGLMRLHAERGDRPSALRQYERCRDALHRQLGVAPSTETERLRETIASTEVERAPEARATPTARAAPAPPAPAPPPSVRGDDGRLTLAIVPFEADSDDAEVRILAQGLCEDVNTELSRFRQLALVSRGSVAELATRTRNTEDIAKATGARLLLVGSVRRAGDRVRVTASLVDGTTGLQLWAERWDTGLDDPFAAVDRLTRNVVGALSLSIDEARLGQARRRPRERLEVYECWLRGIECLRRGTPQSDEEARGFFQQALAASPTFARAYSGISLSHFNDWSCQAWDRWDERERLAFEYARKAVELDAADHVTHYILARIHVYRREFEIGERHLEQALSLNSNDPDMLVHAAVALFQLGQPERASRLVDDALALNPRPPDWYYGVAIAPRFFAHDLEEGIRLALRAPDVAVDTRAFLAASFAHLNQLEAARDHARKFVEHIRTKIHHGPDPAPSEPARWLLHVNPLRRPSDTEYLLEGLRRAGLPAE